MKYVVKDFFDPGTFTLSYVVYDEKTKDAVLIDPVLDYDPAASTVSQKSAKEVKSWIDSKSLKIHYILETHAHADHLSSSQIFKEFYPQAKLAIGERIKEVQETFKRVFNLPESFKTDGSQFDVLLKDNEIFKAGSLEIKVLFTPGHTPACASYLIGDAVFTGDALFMPDSGTGRCDFPKGNAEALYDSITQKIYTLPDSTRVFVGHDYQPNGRAVMCESTVGEEKEKNIQLKGSTGKNEYVEFRTSRDKTLSAPKLLLQSVQFNIDAGHMPKKEANGMAYLKIPIRST